MRPRSRLPRKTVCLSSCSRSSNRARSPTSCAGRATLPSSVEGVVEPNATGEARPQQADWEGLMATTAFDMNDLKRRMQGALSSLKQELSGLRTGRASSGLLDHLQV